MSLTQILLREFQEKNYLYHFTSPRTLQKILKSNVLKRGRVNVGIANAGHSYDIPKDTKGVSLTRNRKHSDSIALVFDRDKLKTKYKIYPVDPEYPSRGTSTFEPYKYYEEVIIKDIKPLDKFLEFIYIPDWNFNILYGYQIDVLQFLHNNKIPMKRFKNSNFVDFNIYEYH